MSESPNLLLELQTAVAGAAEELPRLHLRNASRALNTAIEAFKASPDADTLRNLNCAWAAGNRTLSRYGRQERGIA
jgi:uncharacterized iron-regulated protein